MRQQKEENLGRFFAFFAIAISASLGIAFSRNLLTLFLFYEVLTLCTFPLVTHRGNEDAKQAGRVYLGLLLFTSITFLFLAIAWTWLAAGTLEFTPGGVLAGKVDGGHAVILLALFAFGTGKAALMPFHRWLPRAMAAPAPVSALLHAVAVVKAGAFTVVKVIVYIFGLSHLRETGVSEWLTYAAAITLLIASVIALSKDNLKARLAYSTISQLAYIVLGAAMATTAGVLGAGLHIAMHAMGKITLFLCAGAIYSVTKQIELKHMNGVGRIMPWTMGAFALASLSLVGVPPGGGMWSKWMLVSGAVEAGQPLLVACLLVGSLLSVAYLLPIISRAFFSPPSQALVDRMAEVEMGEARKLCVVPLCITGAGSVALFFLADPILALLAPITGGP